MSRQVVIALLLVSLVVAAIAVVVLQFGSNDTRTQDALGVEDVDAGAPRPTERTFTDEELLSTASPLELIQSSRWSDRIHGYKRLARDADIHEKSELIDVVFSAIEQEKDLRCFPYVFWPLDRSEKLGEDAMNRLFALLENERPEVWYWAAYTLANRGARWEDPALYARKKSSVTGILSLRLHMAGSYSSGYAKELQAMGKDAYSFLVSCATYEVDERCPDLFGRACDMLAWLGNKEAVPILVSAISDLHENGKTQNRGAPGFALRAINKLLDANYGAIGQDFSVLDSLAVNQVDWAAVLVQLKSDSRE